MEREGSEGIGRNCTTTHSTFAGCYNSVHVTINNWCKFHNPRNTCEDSCITIVQNPKDCDSAKKLACNMGKGCGYGCQLHHLIYCFMVAYGTQRTLIIESKGWKYASGGWETVFLPVSDTCSQATGSRLPWSSGNLKDAETVDLPIVDTLYPRPPYMPLAIPKDLAPRLTRLHGHPAVWWIGQFVKYLVRPQPDLQTQMNTYHEKLNFHGPIVG